MATPADAVGQRADLHLGGHLEADPRRTGLVQRPYVAYSLVQDGVKWIDGVRMGMWLAQHLLSLSLLSLLTAPVRARFRVFAVSIPASQWSTLRAGSICMSAP